MGEPIKNGYSKINFRSSVDGFHEMYSRTFCVNEPPPNSTTFFKFLAEAHGGGSLPIFTVILPDKQEE